jgi:hypothetical protein
MLDASKSLASLATSAYEMGVAAETKVATFRAKRVPASTCRDALLSRGLL